MSWPDAKGKSAPSYDYLKDRLKKGQYTPGRRLSPAELAGQFRISATPIHDALLRLAHEGYLTWTASRGFFVKPFLVAEQRDLFQLLQLSLWLSLDLGGADPTKALLEEIVALAAERPPFESAQPRGPADAMARRLEDLYAGLASATGNLVLASQVPAYIERTYRIRRLDFADAARCAAVAADLSRTARAVLARDRDSALDLGRAALAALTDRLPPLVALANSQAMQTDIQ